MKVSGKFRRDHSREHGVTMVLVALAMVAIIAMAAMSIDLVTLYLAREEAQRGADSAALAAARIISLSGVTATGIPSSGNWPSICGGPPGWATQAAQAAVAQNSVGGQAVTVNVTYSDGTTADPDCSTLSNAFEVNPLVTVQVVPVNIPNFFSRIWGRAGNNISASATAEVFNPSASDITGIAPNTNVTPVEPRCVKPWIIPNLDPKAGCTSCNPIVSIADGAIQNQGVSLGGSGSSGMIGEQIKLYADCSSTTGPCTLIPGDNPPKANALPVPPNNLQYLPGSVQSPSQAVPGCATGGSDYEAAVAGCDQTTVYQCGQQVPPSGNPNLVDLSENPSGIGGDTAVGLACSLTGSTTLPLVGQDTLRTSGYPFVAIAGPANPLRISGAPITSSNSIVSLPIYDQNSGTISPTGTSTVTIVGFLQVFVNDVSTLDGSINVTVLNVAGCGSNGTTNPPVFGSSPLPIRLIQPR